MPKIRRGGFVFLAWKGDHGPRHVHVYRNGTLMVKWDLENRTVLKGRANRRIRSLIATLQSEGVL
jgi:hypothetical protein